MFNLGSAHLNQLYSYSQLSYKLCSKQQHSEPEWDDDSSNCYDDSDDLDLREREVPYSEEDTNEDGHPPIIVPPKPVVNIGKAKKPAVVAQK